MTNGNPHAVATDSVQVKSKQNIAEIAHVIGQTDDEHGNSGKSRNLPRVFYSQCIKYPVGILRIRTEGIGALTRQ
jgi:hypothetical protein